ncbi:MAG: hypothetical protein J4215_02285 [Candidatus Diapherotrites archaeon]|uniref:Uncharacterized protein n=1 Tax=Candidatus Iainarchaeum sp. TaxID=3101447 RepID=A0A8T4L242_9ARCH|nr:hypothetical protein [Candidatus Diapherotrites archaeon]
MVVETAGEVKMKIKKEMELFEPNKEKNFDLAQLDEEDQKSWRDQAVRAVQNSFLNYYLVVGSALVLLLGILLDPRKFLETYLPQQVQNIWVAMIFVLVVGMLLAYILHRTRNEANKRIEKIWQEYLDNKKKESKK